MFVLRGPQLTIAWRTRRERRRRCAGAELGSERERVFVRHELAASWSRPRCIGRTCASVHFSELYDGGSIGPMANGARGRRDRRCGHAYPPWRFPTRGGALRQRLLQCVSSRGGLDGPATAPLAGARLRGSLRLWPRAVYLGWQRPRCLPRHCGDRLGGHSEGESDAPERVRCDGEQPLDSRGATFFRAWVARAVRLIRHGMLGRSCCSALRVSRIAGARVRECARCWCQPDASSGGEHQLCHCRHDVGDG